MNLTNFEDFLSEWIRNLDDDYKLGQGKGCPFAKPAKEKNRLKTVKVSDYSNPYQYWSVVSSECESFDFDNNDITIVVSSSNPNIINEQQLGGAVDCLNSFLSIQKSNLWLVWVYSQWFTIVLINPLTGLDDSAKILEEKGYYSDDMFVSVRRKMRELL